VIDLSSSTAFGRSVYAGDPCTTGMRHAGLAGAFSAVEELVKYHKLS